MATAAEAGCVQHITPGKDAILSCSELNGVTHIMLSSKLIEVPLCLFIQVNPLIPSWAMTGPL